MVEGRRSDRSEILGAVSEGAVGPPQVLTRLVNRGGQRIGAGHIIPPSDQPAASVERENREFCRGRRDTQLRDNLSVEIRHDKNIVARIAVKMLGGVNFLQLFRFRVQPVPDDRRGDPAKRREDLLLKVHHRNQPILGVAQIDARKSVADHLRFLLVLPRHDRDDCDVAIGGGKLMLIHIRERQRVSVPELQLNRSHRGMAATSNAARKNIEAGGRTRVRTLSNDEAL